MLALFITGGKKSAPFCNLLRCWLYLIYVPQIKALTMKKILSVSLLLSIATCSFAQEKTIEKTFSNVKSIQLGTGSGDIVINRSNSGNVDMTVRHSFDEGFTPTIEQNNGKLILKEEFSTENHSGNSTWTLAIPDNISLKVNTGSGNINLENVQVDLESSQGSGDIEISRVTGEDRKSVV